MSSSPFLLKDTITILHHRFILLTKYRWLDCFCVTRESLAIPAIERPIEHEGSTKGRKREDSVSRTSDDGFL